MDEMTSLRHRLERALGGRAIEELWPEPRALVGFEAAVALSVDRALARRAFDKLRAGSRLLPVESAVLEVAIRMARPALRIERGRLPPHSFLEMEEAVRAILLAQLPGIASLGFRWGIPLATAFQVAPRVLVTSAHVADRLEQEREDLTRGNFVAHFDADDRHEERIVSITGVLVRHPSEDVALLEMEAEGPLDGGLRLARRPADSRARRVLGVGYPLYGDGHLPWVDSLFEHVYGVLRASPGELMGAEGERLFHDCTTLSGNSGSPLFDLSTGLVIGVHSSGKFAWRNTAVSTRALLSNEFIRARASCWD
ncbi:hypothetical protein CYFUS_003397 [Cystobacter fuscus]|uniref:Serine protease n=1 Tax=Cystobacter fuscus TaxID=43 RepID=A0A250J3L9_9BACT|nr:serine protease [Cystobacter fuscus]ATB37971.1 hypothetical protein CYFUS_003397 [Cystobacter fuscus]